MPKYTCKGRGKMLKRSEQFIVVLQKEAAA
jgi:hypothetical protein